MAENLSPSQLSLGCQAEDGSNCGDGVAPEGALHLSDGKQGESPDGGRAVVNEAAGASSPFGLPSLSQDRQVYRTSELPEEWVEAIKNSQAAGHDATCPLCGEKCDAFAGNPGKWPIPLAKDFLCVYHHMGCVSAIVYRERDTRPKDGDPQGAPLASSPVPEGNSPDVPAANKSASLTHQGEA